jgi:hypothetical protein
MAKTEMYTTKLGERRFQVAAPVSEEVFQALRNVAFDEETTLAAQVRKAVEEYVSRKKPPSRNVS